jgi:hypothetical protein
MQFSFCNTYITRVRFVFKCNLNGKFCKQQCLKKILFSFKMVELTTLIIHLSFLSTDLCLAHHNFNELMHRWVKRDHI